MNTQLSLTSSVLLPDSIVTYLEGDIQQSESIFCGIGLCRPNGPTIQIPFDAIGYMGAALSVAKSHQKKCIIFLADAHAYNTQHRQHHPIIRATTDYFCTIAENLAKFLEHPVDVRKATDIVGKDFYY